MAKAAAQPMPLASVLGNAVRFLALIGAGAMALSRECDNLILVVFAVLFTIGFFLERHTSAVKLMGLLQPFFAVFIFCIAIADFLYLSNSFLLAIAHFLLSLQGLRLLALQTHRESMGSILLSSMMLLSASTLSVEWTFLVMLLVFLPVIIWTLTVHNISLEWGRALAVRPETEKQAPLPAVQDPVWLKLKPLLRGCAGLAFLVTVTCCAAVFLAFPRFNFRGFKGQYLQPVHKSGFTNQVNLYKSGKIFEDKTVAMRVEIAPEDRPRWTGYLRGGTLDQFNGRIWTHSSLAAKSVYAQKGGVVELVSRSLDQKKLLHQTVYLESMDSPILFAAPYPVRFKVNRPFLEVRSDGSVLRGHGDTWRFHYEVDSVPVKVREGQPRTQSPSPSIRGSDAVHTLALQITQGARTNSEKAQRICDYLRFNYTYSLHLQASSPQKSPIEAFLFEHKRGQCEYFASAMTLLLTKLGIPARMVTGFLSHEWSQRGHYYIVRMKNAHAWVEVNVDKKGWVAFDPSPREVETGAVQSVWRREILEFMDHLNLRWNRYILSYDIERQSEILKTISRTSFQISANLTQWTNWMSEAISPFKRDRGMPQKGNTSKDLWNYGLGAMGTAFLGIFAFWFFNRRKSSKNRIWFYKEVVRYLEKNDGKKKKRTAQTLKEFRQSLNRNYEGKAAVLEYLEREYYRLRFDPKALPSSEIQRAIAHSLKQLKK